MECNNKMKNKNKSTKIESNKNNEQKNIKIETYSNISNKI